MQTLRVQEAELECKYESYREHLRQLKHQNEEEDLGATRNALLQENRALRKRKEEFLAWEYRVNVLLGRQEDDKEEIAHRNSDLLPERKQNSVSLTLKHPMTVTECHTIARRAYREIQAFTECQDFVTTGLSVFGWTDRRKIENGLLKFALSKQVTGVTPEYVSSRIWALLSSPGGYANVHSQSLNMRSEIVQVVDENNVIVTQEYQVENDQSASAVIVRTIVLLTQFETENGYIVLIHSLDALATDLPGAISNANVHYEWLPVFSWCTIEKVGDECRSSYVGTVRVEGANYMNWAVEVLLLVLRCEIHVLGPLWTLPQQE